MPRAVVQRRPCRPRLAQGKTDAMLEVDGLVKAFGGFRAVDGCTLKVNKGEILGLIGPNGAGKTTLFNLIAGALQPTSGTIRFLGEDVTPLSTDALFHKGLVRTFQIPHEFHNLSARENLMMVPSAQPGENLFANWFAAGKVRAAEEAVRGEGQRHARLPGARARRRRARRQPLRWAEEAARARPHDDDRRQTGAARRARRWRQTAPCCASSRRRSSSSTASAATPSSSSNTTWR